MQIKNKCQANCLQALLLIVTSCFVTTFEAVAAEDKKPRPNVLMISIDDLNDWPNVMGVRTDTISPNIDRLARNGVLFRRAYSQYPLCGPSRASVFTGLLPTTLGYTDHPKDKDVAKRVRQHGGVLLHEHFGNSGYKTMAVGKLMHRHVPKGTVDMSGGRGNWGERPDGKELNWKSSKTLTDWGVYPGTDDQLADYQAAQWAIERLQEQHGQPFLLMVGFIRPHAPWYVPKKWFDKYDRSKLNVPPFQKDDLNDVPVFSRNTNLANRQQPGRMPTTDWLIENNQWQHLVQSYLASLSFVDYYVGEVVTALQRSGYRDNTIIVLWSDHGYHLGEKNTVQKHSLWERSAHIPMIFAGPSIQSGKFCERVVSLVDLYPTLADLCNLPSLQNSDGRSVAPLLRNPDRHWDFPAISSYRGQNFAVQSERYRYYLYKDGSEELYDHVNDLNEWQNLADDDGLVSVKKTLQLRLKGVVERDRSLTD